MKRPKISRVLGWIALLASTLAISLFVSSRTVTQTGERPVAQQQIEVKDYSPDFVSYHEIKKIPTTVCSVVKNPSQFVGKILSFNASVGSDCRHFTLLMDNSCGRGLSFTVPDTVEEQWEPIGNVMCVGLKRESKPVRGHFTGLFVRDTDRPDGLFPYRVELTSITNVELH